MPGKFGDILWSLPTVRAISEAAGAPVDLAVSKNYGSICPLIAIQPYIATCVNFLDWEVRDTAPMTPQRPPNPPPPDAYDKVIHLGYERWPMNLLPMEIYLQATGQWGSALPGLELDRPWIEVKAGKQYRQRVMCGFTDEWFELKYGLVHLIDRAFFEYDDAFDTQLTDSGLLAFWPSAIPGSRWAKEGGVCSDRSSWMETAVDFAGADLFLGCLSSLWVLANALGIPTVIMEPAEARHHPIFYYDHPRNHLVLGNDGKPTFDARAVIAMVKEALHA